jgi:hypothetical protein
VNHPGAHAGEAASEGNHRLTALTGSLLVPLIGVVYLTGLMMDAWWHVHYVIGFVLIPVVALKLGTTGYRALRYYAGNRAYVAAGPPIVFLRVMAPLLVLAVVVALVTGVLLFADRSRTGTLSTLHTDSAVVAAGLIGIHFLAYIRDALPTSWRDLTARPRGAGRAGTVALALFAGVLLASLTFGAGVWPARDRGPRGGDGVVAPPHAVIAVGGAAGMQTPASEVLRRLGP